MLDATKQSIDQSARPMVPELITKGDGGTLPRVDFKEAESAGLVVPPLTSESVPDLATLEAIIERGLQTFVEVGNALRGIVERKLYRDAGYETFEGYVHGRFGWTRQHAYSHIQAATVAENVRSICQSPPSLTQAMALAPLSPEKQREIAARTDFGQVSVSQLKAEIRGDALETSTIAEPEPRRKKGPRKLLFLKEPVVAAGITRGPLTRLLMSGVKPKVTVTVEGLGEIDTEDFITVRYGLERVTHSRMEDLWDYWECALGVSKAELKARKEKLKKEYRVPEQEPGSVYEVRPGAYYLTGFLSPDEQKRLVEVCHELQYVHSVQRAKFGGGELKKTKACLGRKIVAYEYEATPSVPPVPQRWKELAAQVAARVAEEFPTRVDTTFDADIAIVNVYPKETEFGEHRDNDEREETLRKGVPVVSFSLGCDSDFTFEREGVHPHEGSLPRTIRLHSGDAFIWGGPARLALHSIAKLGTGPSDLGIARVGVAKPEDPDTQRINITLRQW